MSHQCLSDDPSELKHGVSSSVSPPEKTIIGSDPTVQASAIWRPQPTGPDFAIEPCGVARIPVRSTSTYIATPHQPVSTGDDKHSDISDNAFWCPTIQDVSYRTLAQVFVILPAVRL